MRIYQKVLFFIFAIFLSNGSWADNNEEWIIRAEHNNQENYYGVIVGNGGIGILSDKKPFKVQQVMLNHIFDFNGVSRVLRGLNPFELQVSIDDKIIDETVISEWGQELDMKNAVLKCMFNTSGKANVEYEICALRHMPYAGMIQVKIHALKDIKLNVKNPISITDEYEHENAGSLGLNVDGHNMYIKRKSALSKQRQVLVSASSAFLLEKESGVSFENKEQINSFSLLLKQGESFSFSLIGAICTSRDFLDPQNESDREVSYALCEGADRLMDLHRRHWKELWQGDIQIEGDKEAQRLVRLALYNLYSSAREGSNLSIPPFGLSSQGYNGHIFWDTELWMYPPMLFLNQGIAQSMMNYRIDRLDGARKKAQAYGFKGVMFPWESDDTGEEACPTWALTGAFEHHITPDVAFAVWNFYCMNKDRKWLKDKGYPLLKEVAEFCISRVDKNNDGSYSIRNVVCPDEYAVNVDDNAFTNGAVRLALQNATKAASICGEKAPKIWKEVSEKLRIPRSAEGVTLEYEVYDGRIIKQADANLLAYPLAIITDPEIIKKDLKYYEDKIDKGGPMMSFSVLAAQYARLGDGDKAYELFTQAFRPNQLPPFGVLAEGAGGTNPYFMTGAGGLLQAVINGFCGLEITENGVKQLPSSLPKHWKKVIITGVGPNRKTFVRQ